MSIEKQNKESLDDLNDLVNELKSTKSLSGILAPPAATPTEAETINEDNMDDFIFRKSSLLIQQGMDIIESLKMTMKSSNGDPEGIEAYSKLITSVANSLEILNKVNLQKRKEKAAKELKQLELNASSKLLDKYDNNTTIKNQTNIIVASREEIMQALINKAGDMAGHQGEVIDTI